MKRLIGFILTTILLLSIAGCNTSSVSQQQAKNIADSYIQDFTQNNFDKMVTGYDMTAQVKQAVTTEVFAQVWNQQLLTASGEYVKTDMNAASIKKVSGIYQITYRLEFTYQDAKIMVAVNNKGQIASFLLTGFESNVSKEFPSDIKTEEVKFGKSPYQISGTVVSKIGVENTPCAIIIAGSGPNERYGKMGANAPYFDIASALAQKGITVLIYDKRTHTYASKLAKADITIKDEVIDDSKYAFDFMSAYKGINNQKIFFIGHSLGGYLLPMIDEATQSKAAGYIFMAAPSSAMEDLMLMQIKYLAQLDGTVTSDEQTNIDMAAAMQKNVKALTQQNKNQNASSALFNVPASYWLSLQGYKPYEKASDIKAPMLFLNGDRDYQVPLSESEAYKNALANRGDVEFIVFAGLDHLFFYGEGKPNPSEYYIPSIVSNQVTDKIADFINNH